MDFILWPRNDIEKIVCLLFSRWKGADDEPFRPVQVRALRLLFPTAPCCKGSGDFDRVDFLPFRQSLNFITGTTRSSACMLWVAKTRQEWSWTTRLSLYFSSWIDTTYRWVSPEEHRHWVGGKALTPDETRLKHHVTAFAFTLCRRRKPRPQFSSCAASACTYPKTSWPAGAWETSRTTSARTCLTEALCSSQPHRKKPFPSLLPKPSEAKWCTHLHLFPFQRFELVLGSLFMLPTCPPPLTLRWFSSHPCFPYTHPSSFCHFWIGSPLFYFTTPSFPSTHSSIFIFSFIWTCTNIDFEWLVVLSEPHRQQQWSLKELFCCIKTGNQKKKKQVFMVGLRWTCSTSLLS